MNLEKGFRRMAWVAVALAAAPIALYAYALSDRVEDYEPRLLTSEFPSLQDRMRTPIAVDDLGLFYVPAGLSKDESEAWMRAAHPKVVAPAVSPKDSRLSIKEFAARIRAKRSPLPAGFVLESPDDDITVTKNALTEYPVYREQVTFREYEIVEVRRKSVGRAIGGAAAALLLLTIVLQGGISVVAWIARGFRSAV